LRRRRHRVGLPDRWREILDSRSALWRTLEGADRDRLGELADWLLRERRWEAARGFVLTDDVRAVLAAHAVMPILGLDESWYDGVGTIIVRDGSMTQRHTPGPVRGTFERSPQVVDGESYHRDGPLMVSWRAARREAANPRFGRDVVLHEFAHKIDMHDGVLDGTPLLPDDAQRERWVDVCTAHFEAVRDGEPDAFLRSYAGTDAGEFFAVASETFFTRPIELAARKPGLYEVFADFYRQDPAARASAYLARSAPAAADATRPRIVVRRAVLRAERGDGSDGPST
jgi:Mlc titration factor MtfA (ptsG expression regulator)